MKVLWECEKCGHRWEPKSWDHYTGAIAVQEEPCPVCHLSEPTYGPITVEMVAEMLCNAPRSSSWEDQLDLGNDGCEFTADDFRAMAHAVFRLLGLGGAYFPETREGGSLPNVFGRPLAVRDTLPVDWKPIVLSCAWEG